MYNLMHVCGFCHQFFDPEFDGGIAYPNRQKKKRAAVRGVVDSATEFTVPAADVRNTDEFFDERFPLRETNFFQDRSLLESRARARFVLDLLAAKERENEEEEV